MTKYECYVIVADTTKEAQDEANEMGDREWEPVGIAVTGSYVRILMRRAIEEEKR